MNLKILSDLIKEKGRLQVSYDPSGSGMGYYWCATLGGEWPFCNADTLENSITVLISEHLRLKKETLQRQIKEIDESSNL